MNNIPLSLIVRRAFKKCHTKKEKSLSDFEAFKKIPLAKFSQFLCLIYPAYILNRWLMLEENSPGLNNTSFYSLIICHYLRYTEL